MATSANSLKERNGPPSHYQFKIWSFSLLSKALVDKFCSNVFEAGGHKWKLWIYPTGDKTRNGKDYLSIYLELLETSSLPTGWEVIVISNFFIFNDLENKYYSNRDLCELHYHSINTMLGISKFIDKITFSNPGNGYIFGDTCVFGVEVFVVKNTFKEGSLSMMREPAMYYHTWKFVKFSNSINETYVSESFGCYKWNIVLYPNGWEEGKGNSISIYLCVSQSNIPANCNLFVKFLLRVKDQKNRNPVEKKGDYLFAPSNLIYGWGEFLTLAKLKDPKCGYLVDDDLIIEAEVTLLGLILSES